jgi:hypothetical protein
LAAFTLDVFTFVELFQLVRQERDLQLQPFNFSCRNVLIPFIVLFSFVREQVHKLATNLTFEFAILRALFLTRVLLLMKRFCTILLAMMVGVQSLAAVASEEGWSLEAELGAVLTTGNTDQQNLKFRLGGTLDGEVLKHSAQLDGLRSSENSIVTAQKYYTFYQGDYKLQGDHSLFGRISYEDDRFSGFDYQADLTVGYSRLLTLRTRERDQPDGIHYTSCGQV